MGCSKRVRRAGLHVDSGGKLGAVSELGGAGGPDGGGGAVRCGGRGCLSGSGRAGPGGLRGQHGLGAGTARHHGLGRIQSKRIVVVGGSGGWD